MKDSPMLSNFGDFRSWFAFHPKLDEVQIWAPCIGRDSKDLLTLCNFLLEEGRKVHLCVVEASPVRASTLRASLGEISSPRWSFQIAEGDAFALPLEKRKASLLFLSPPEGRDPTCDRTEMRWLKHFYGCLIPGGVLIMDLSSEAVLACAPVLDTFFERLSVRSTNERTLLIGASCKFHSAQVSIFHMMEDPERHGNSNVYTLISGGERPNQWEISRVDSKRFIANARGQGFYVPWGTTDSGVCQSIPKTVPSLPLKELSVRKFRCATEARPGHIAAAIACGAFDSTRISPGTNAPAWVSDIYVKGLFQKAIVSEGIIEKEGEDAREKLKERPQLRATILDTKTYGISELKQSLDPSIDPQSWEDATVGDLLLWFGEALLTEFQNRCFDRYPNPPTLRGVSARSLYPAQEKVTRVSIAYLQDEGAALIQGETGTGKTTMALTTLGEVHCRRILVMAPPQLLAAPQWPSEVIACFPSAKVHLAEDLTALARYTQAVLADPEGFHVLLLNRNVAKLGYGRRGISQCPTCGHKTETDPDTLARGKAKCPGKILSIPPKLRQIAQILWPLGLEEGILSSLGPIKGKHHKAKSVPDWLLSPLYVDLLRSYLELKKEDLSLDSGLYWFRNRGASIPSSVWQEIRQQLLYHPTFLQHLEDVLFGSEPKTSSLTADDIFRLFWDGKEFETRICGEALWCATPPNRVPLAKSLIRIIRDGFIDGVIIDEFHEYANLNTAQSKAARMLLEQRKIPRLILTGSLMNGYASSIFLALWTISRDFRAKFPRNALAKFAEQCGFLRGERTLKGHSASTLTLEQRSSKKKSTKLDFRPTGPAPGVMPDAMLEHLLCSSLTILLSDLRIGLPPKEPTKICYVPMLRQQDETLQKVFLEISKCIQADLSHWGGKTRMMGALTEALSLPDRMVEDVIGVAWPVTYTGMDKSSKLVASFPSISSNLLLPKEEELLRILRKEQDEDRRCVVFSHHRDLVPRLLRICQQVDPKAAYLDARKVPPEERAEWIANVLADGNRILLANPIAVGTGLNGLIPYPTHVWFQPPPKCQPQVKRQADGRAHRIGQDKVCRSYMLVYKHPRLQDEIELLLKKIGISEAVDGLDAASALRASGAGGEEEAFTADLARFIWDRMKQAA